MGLLQPEPGLLIWMTVAFAIVLVLLVRYGFPVILKAMEERKQYVDTSLERAAEAVRRVEGLKDEMDRVKSDAEKEKAVILKSASDAREKIIAEARQRAQEEGERIVAAARAEAGIEREAILRDARHQVAMLSVAISEKLLRTRLADTESQVSLAERLLDEIGGDKVKNGAEV
ncbi:MAG TPA: F0F1 ATP synthase subunit B [Candidatus Coprenecus stercoripullorum]|nr:F0F1 ATP synthase subunit B [Candidatus Coprenecus stercoripullorum]